MRRDGGEREQADAEGVRCHAQVHASTRTERAHTPCTRGNVRVLGLSALLPLARLRSVLVSERDALAERLEEARSASAASEAALGDVQSQLASAKEAEAEAEKQLEMAMALSNKVHTSLFYG